MPLLSKQNAGVESKLLGPLPVHMVEGPVECCASNKATGEQQDSSKEGVEVTTTWQCWSRLWSGWEICRPSFSSRLTITYIIPATPSMQGHPNRRTIPEDDNQATGMGKEDLEKLTRGELLQILHCTMRSSKVSRGDGHQQLSSSPFTRGRRLFALTCWRHPS